VLYQIGFISKEINESGESPNEQYKRLKQLAKTKTF
jgi:hypothetical protein